MTCQGFGDIYSSVSFSLSNIKSNMAPYTGTSLLELEVAVCLSFTPVLPSCKCSKGALKLSHVLLALYHWALNSILLSQ